MKKAQTKSKARSGQYIPSQRRNNSVSKNKSDVTGKVGELLGKLDAGQLTEVFGRVADVAQAGFDYAKEREKTNRVQIEANVELSKIAQLREATLLGHQQEMERITNSGKETTMQHEQNMTMLKQAGEVQNQQHEKVMQIFKMLEEGKISEEKVADIINSTKS